MSIVEICRPVDWVYDIGDPMEVTGDWGHLK
jgi:hypothetical protein